VAENQWAKALKICRSTQNTLFWACLAAMSSKKNQLEISEEAYSSALQIDKVDYMHHIKELEDASPEQMAESALMNGTRISEAETILLHNKKIPETIRFLIRYHRWDRAIEIAEKFSTDIQFVLQERVKYLKALGSDETSLKFIEFNKAYFSKDD
jgi:intraflagellar transport protein 80